MANEMGYLHVRIAHILVEGMRFTMTMTWVWRAQDEQSKINLKRKPRRGQRNLTAQHGGLPLDRPRLGDGQDRGLACTLA